MSTLQTSKLYTTLTTKENIRKVIHVPEESPRVQLKHTLLEHSLDAVQPSPTPFCVSVYEPERTHSYIIIQNIKKGIFRLSFVSFY